MQFRICWMNALLLGSEWYAMNVCLWSCLSTWLEWFFSWMLLTSKTWMCLYVCGMTSSLLMDVFTGLSHADVALDQNS